MPRLELPPEADMTEAQKAACAEAVAGIRGRVPAPMVAWLQNPDLASRGQKLGDQYDRAARVSVLAEPTENLSVFLTADYSKLTSNGSVSRVSKRVG